MKIEEMRRNSNGVSGAKVPVLTRKKLQQVSLSDDCKSIIYGTLLGDGRLYKTKRYKNSQLSIRHSFGQVDYFNWKVDKLQEIASPKSIQKLVSTGLNKPAQLLFQSKACPELTEVQSITHLNNRLRIQRRWCNHLTPLSLAIWWCDDGSIISNGRKGVLCTDDFDEISVRLLANYLQTVWGIYVYVGAIKRDRKCGSSQKRFKCYRTQSVSRHYFRLWFGTEELKKWLRIIMPHLPVASMLYKVIIVYKDSLFQQRWISELKLTLPQFENEIDEFMYNLKHKKSR
jgi:hypothetical protein